MTKSKIPPISVGFILIMLLSFCWAAEATMRIDRSTKSDHEELQNTTFTQREEAFNHTLTSLFLLEDEELSEAAKAKLNYNIGNTFFQLGQFPWAILYYYKALEDFPRDEKIVHNLLEAQSQAGLKPFIQRDILEEGFSIFGFFSLKERWMLTLGIFILYFLARSWFLWHPLKVVKWMSHGLLLSGLLFILNLMLSHYLKPLHGVLIHPTLLYQGSSRQYIHVLQQPLLPGTRVKVIEVIADGKWLKIITPENQVGYVENGEMRLI